MVETADVIVVGAGVHGASLAFHLTRRGARVVVLERSNVGAGATGRSSGFVRMHYDLEADARLAWASFPWFREWQDRVGAGDCGFVRTGFVQLVTPELADALRANVAMHQRIGIPTSVIGPDEVAGLAAGIAVDDIVAAAYEPESGYADPSGTAAGFLAAARAAGASFVHGCRVESVLVDGERVAGVETDRGRFDAPVVVNAAGAWAPELARTVGLSIPVEPWRHLTGYFGLPSGRSPDFPVVIDNPNQCYFRPEGHDLMLVGLESDNVVGGSPDRPLVAMDEPSIETMVHAVCGRLPWMTAGTFNTSHGGQDGITPDQRSILGRAGPDGFFLDCGHSGTGFKTAPAVGLGMAELILDGTATTVDLTPYALERFDAGRPLEAEHPYGPLWK